MKKIRPFNTALRGATQRGEPSVMTKVLVLSATAAISLLAVAAVDCGSYSSPANGAAGSTSSPSGGGSSTVGGSSGVAGSPGSTSSGGSVDNSSGGSTQPSGGSTAASGGDTTASGGTGGATTAGGAGGAIAVGGGSGAGAGGSGGGATIALPCGILSAGGVKCVSAHSTVRVIVPGYTGPLYQVCKGTTNPGPSSCKGTAQDIGSQNGYANSAAQDTFCGTGACKITKIYDQSGMKNDLEPAPAGGPQSGPTPDVPADAAALKITVSGHPAYGILIKPGMGYRTGCAGCNIKTGNGMATGDQPQTLYWVTSQKDVNSGCCFDYGNAETTSHDDGAGTMEALYFGQNTTWGTGVGSGPWMMADLENGLFAGWEKKQNKGISTSASIKYDFVSGVVLGDTQDKNVTKGRFAVYGGDATSGTLQTLYDGIRPETPGYVPMKKQGSIILGIGGDNSKGAGGHFYEGAIATGPVVAKQTVDALQAAIVATNYGK